MKIKAAQVLYTFFVVQLVFFFLITTTQIQAQSEPVQNLMNTGNNDSVSNQQNSNSVQAFNNQDQASINQITNAVANTGYNEASRNISIGGNAGVITTGDALINTTAKVSANNSLTEVSTLPNSVQPLTSLITNSGNELQSLTQQNAQQTTVVNNNKTTLINQITNASANTGHNVADRNISIGGNAGVITTGTAGVQTNSLVTANNSVALVGGTDANGNGGPGSGASIILANTGNRANFSSAFDQTNQTTVQNSNNALVNQSCGGEVACSVSTGGNQSNRGVSRGGNAGVIETGNAVLNLNFFANLNPQFTQLSGGYDTQSSPASPQNVLNSGDNLNLSQSSSQNTQTSLASTSIANVTQQADVVADTGHNVADRNVSIGGDAGVIKTGTALITLLMNVLANPSQIQ